MQSGPDVFDRDIDPQPRRPARSDRGSIVPSQRLIVNPFLAVLGFVIIVAIWREAFSRRSSGLFQLGAALLLVVGFLVQYHCLDCGATGWLIRCRRHACPTVVALGAGRVAAISRSRRAVSALDLVHLAGSGVRAGTGVVDRRLTARDSKPLSMDNT